MAGSNFHHAGPPNFHPTCTPPTHLSSFGTACADALCHDSAERENPQHQKPQLVVMRHFLERLDDYCEKNKQSSKECALHQRSLWSKRHMSRESESHLEGFQFERGGRSSQGRLHLGRCWGRLHSLRLGRGDIQGKTGVSLAEPTAAPLPGSNWCGGSVPSDSTCLQECDSEGNSYPPQQFMFSLTIAHVAFLLLVST